MVLVLLGKSLVKLNGTIVVSEVTMVLGLTSEDTRRSGKHNSFSTYARQAQQAQLGMYWNNQLSLMLLACLSWCASKQVVELSIAALPGYAMQVMSVRSSEQ